MIGKHCARKKKAKKTAIAKKKRSKKRKNFIARLKVAIHFTDVLSNSCFLEWL